MASAIVSYCTAPLAFGIPHRGTAKNDRIIVA